jgi:hypothetical protein
MNDPDSGPISEKAEPKNYQEWKDIADHTHMYQG